jgi:hypothetical protein
MKVNSETCHKALIEYQQKYGDDALTEHERMFLYGIVNYDEFKRLVSVPQDEPLETLGITKEDLYREFKLQLTENAKQLYP